MNQLQRFYQWVSNSPSLFELRPPMVDFLNNTIPPLSESLRYDGNPRLGFLYQYLCTHVIESTEHFQIELEEIQLNAACGRTLGAIDLILHNQQKQRFEHWEVAIKFYLLHNGTWYGPNAHDQLDKKLDRMLSHQLKMSHTDEFRNEHSQYEPLTEQLLMQGRLYINPFSPEEVPNECLGYPLNPTQINGYWCYQSQWDLLEEPLYELEKPLWAVGREEFATPIEKPDGRFVHAQTESGQFWFVVPDSWPNK